MLRPSRRVRLAVAAAVFAATGALLPAPDATAAARCGPPDQAPGFEVPARRSVVPDARCMDLQLAQDKVEAAGLHNARAEDATGRDRSQFQDQEWVVVDQSPAPGTKVRPGTRVRFSVLAYGDRGAPPVPDRSRPGPLPRLTCFDLQEAKDTLQSAGFNDVRSRDASRRGRRQFADRNWTVNDQRPAPGGDWAKSTRVTLVVLKDGETRSC